MSESTLWRISDFTDGPHWDAAIVRAATADAAKAALAAKIGTDEDNYPDTVWNLDAPEGWTVEEVSGEDAVIFLLGAGCRG